MDDHTATELEKDMTDLVSKTAAELIAMYNELGPDVALKTWKKPKSALVELIEQLQFDREIDAEDDIDDDIDNWVDNIAEEAAELAEDAAAEEKPRTIRQASIDHLCAVAYYEDRSEKSKDENRVEADNPKARSVGIAYDEIIRLIQDEFPGCKTTVACLRWYSVKIRVEEAGYEELRLPQRRPRAKPTTK